MCTKISFIPGRGKPRLQRGDSFPQHGVRCIKVRASSGGARSSGQTLNMSALKFLSKKSWHTSTIKNNEKVWLREQAAAAEAGRVAELQKQLEEERKAEEIADLELKSGRLGPAELARRRRIEWMYEVKKGEDTGVTEKDKEKEREDTLLGKKEAVLGGTVGAVDDASVAVQLIVDAEAKMREDPMMIIQRERAHALAAASVRAAALGKRAEKRKSSDEFLDDDDAKRAKRARKDMRREAREERRRRREDRLSRKYSGVDDSYDMPERGPCDKRREKPQLPVHSTRNTHRVVQGVQPGYGLQIPEGGTAVTVHKQFERRERDSLPSSRRPSTASAPSRTRPRSSRPPLPLSARERAEDRSRRLEEMRTDADVLDRERSQRVRRRVEDATREEREEYEHRVAASSRDGLEEGRTMRAFARDAIGGSERGVSVDGRIQQRRAWSTRNEHASY